MSGVTGVGSVSGLAASPLGNGQGQQALSLHGCNQLPLLGTARVVVTRGRLVSPSPKFVASALL